MSYSRIHHINCGTLSVPPYDTVVCHCILLEDRDGLTLIDTGIGMQDVNHPIERLGADLIEVAGFQFNEADTAVSRITSLGLETNDVRNIVLTHADPDHAGGLSDFPQAAVHLSTEELNQIEAVHWRYAPKQFSHRPEWKTHDDSQTKDWFGIESRRLDLELSSEVLLIPLFGHTLGHCGVAIQQDWGWLLHVGDAYYLKDELIDLNHPVDSLASERADDNDLRLQSLAQLRRLNFDHRDEVKMIGYHDIKELPEDVREEPAHKN